LVEGLALRLYPFIVIPYSMHPDFGFGDITLPSGKCGFAVYKDGKIVTQYAIINWK